jgi:hypothetical protein
MKPGDLVRIYGSAAIAVWLGELLLANVRMLGPGELVIFRGFDIDDLGRLSILCRHGLCNTSNSMMEYMHETR